jgi:predicted HicB family RNase H-like nuclease
MPKGAKLKTATMSLRIEPQTKAAAKLAARAERRSVANFIEVLILRHCQERGIEIRSSKASRRET